MTTVEVPVPPGMEPEMVRDYVRHLLASRTATERVAAVLQQQDAATGPATAAQLASVEQLWRHLIDDGVYTAADIARLRGAKPSNRSVASNLAKTHGLIGVARGHAKVYPVFEFSGAEPNPAWAPATRPLLDAGWEGPDILLWMVSPNARLSGREPATLLNPDGEDQLISLAETEARGVW